MFRKFTNRITNRIGSDGENRNSSQVASAVETLQAMGFDAASIQQALASSNGNLDQATDALLSRQGSPSNSQSTPSRAEEESLQRAIQESLRTVPLTPHEHAQRSKPTVPRTAAVSKAAQAAARRAATARETVSVTPHSASTSLAIHHPEVRLVPKLQDKSKEEQILRCADRMKASPAAVDTLLRTLSAVQKEPSNDKFRKIDKSTPGYQRSVAKTPGAEDLLRAMNYRLVPSRPNELIIDRSMIDPALLYLGISALEQVKGTPEYQQGKAQLTFTKELATIRASADCSTEEAIRRSTYMGQCPSEPTEGRGALVQIVLVDEVIRRRFDGDDILNDILHWLGGHGSAIPDKLLSRTWTLVDRNANPPSSIDCVANRNNTLQYIGCWPSGKLELLPNTED
jgi:hypothetical protein